MSIKTKKPQEQVVGVFYDFKFFLQFFQSINQFKIEVKVQQGLVCFDTSMTWTIWRLYSTFFEIKLRFMNLFLMWFMII